MTLATLAEAECRFDGPLPPGAERDEMERRAAAIAEARAARDFAYDRFQRCLRHARAHRLQARQDLIDLMLRDAREWRRGFRHWNRSLRHLLSLEAADAVRPRR